MSLIPRKFDVKSVIFPNFGQGPFPKIAGKSPAIFYLDYVANLAGLSITRSQTLRQVFSR